MPWACKVGGKSIRLDDIEIGVIGEIARTVEMDWITLVNVPCLDERAGRALVVKCAELLEVSPPEKFTARTLLDSFETVEDDLPELFEDGVPTEGAGEKATD